MFRVKRTRCILFIATVKKTVKGATSGFSNCVEPGIPSGKILYHLLQQEFIQNAFEWVNPVYFLIL